MSKSSRFTGKVAQVANNAVGERGEVAVPQGGSGFAEYAVVSLHCACLPEKILSRSVRSAERDATNTRESSLESADLSDHSILVMCLTE